MEGIIQENIVWKVLDEAAGSLPDRTGFSCQGTDISFGKMNEISDRVASSFLNMGLRKGDRIGIIALNQLEWLYTFFAAAKIGAIVVGLNVRYRETELNYMLNHSKTRALVTLAQLGDMNYVDFFGRIRESIPSVKEYFFIGEKGFPGSYAFDDLLSGEVDRALLDKAKAAVQPDDSMIIIYTSGTTGIPKGSNITHRSYLASGRAQAEHTRVQEDDLMINALPLNHVAGITCGVATMLMGKGTTLLIPAFVPAEVIKQAASNPTTYFAAVPTMHTLLMMNEYFASWDRSGMRILITGGSNAEPELLRKLYDSYPNATLMNLYGLSESSGAVVLSPWESDFDKNVQSIGIMIDDFQAKTVDLERHDLPSGETGELCIKGDAVVPGYFNMPEETNEAFDQDGWLHTGDMAYIDDEGFIYLMGRKKEMYIQGGFNVYPVEVENLLSKHSDVMMVAGIGVPDPVLGEIGRFYIVPKQGSKPTEEEIRAFCREHLADYKVPKQVVFREELPLTPLGKIMKSKLKEDYEKTGE
jgi:fatty-acyl-CoA synthase